MLKIKRISIGGSDGGPYVKANDIALRWELSSNKSSTKQSG